MPSMLGGIALRARNNSNADGAAILGPPSPCGKRIDDGRSGGSAAAACRRAASGAVGGASVSSPMDPVSGAIGGDSAGSSGVDFGTDERRSLSADANSDAVGTGLALLARAEGRLAFALRSASSPAGVIDCSDSPGDAADDLTPLASPPSWTGVPMKRLPCPKPQPKQSATPLNGARAPGSTLRNRERAARAPPRCQAPPNRGSLETR